MKECSDFADLSITNLAHEIAVSAAISLEDIAFGFQRADLERPR
jgi:hypothetical protein